MDGAEINKFLSEDIRSFLHIRLARLSNPNANRSCRNTSRSYSQQMPKNQFPAHWANHQHIRAHDKFHQQANGVDYVAPQLQISCRCPLSKIVPVGLLGEANQRPLEF